MMPFEFWVTLVVGVFLLGFVVRRFALTLREGELNVGVFLGNFRVLKRAEEPVKFYIAVAVRVVVFTLGILLALWFLQGALAGS